MNSRSNPPRIDGFFCTVPSTSPTGATDTATRGTHSTPSSFIQSPHTEQTQCGDSLTCLASPPWVCYASHGGPFLRPSLFNLRADHPEQSEAVESACATTTANRDK